MNRPDAVPAAAWWSPEENEWVLSDKDAQGRKQGLVRYWRPDGSLVCTTEFVDDKPHGECFRFHETGEVAQSLAYVRGEIHGIRAWFMTDGTTTEKPRHEGLSKEIWRGELDYTHGTVTGFRYWNRAGQRVGMDGKALPTPPPGVPAHAVLNKGGRWTVGTWNEQGAQVGAQHFWRQDGTLESVQTATGTTVHIADTRRDGSKLRDYTLVDRKLHGAALAWRSDGSLQMRAEFGETTVIEHLGPTPRTTTYPPASDKVPVLAQPTEDDQFYLSTLLDEEDPSAIEWIESLAPVGMARAIAIGWGGSDKRFRDHARWMRRLVLKVASPSLRERLGALGMDRMVRMQGPARVTAVIAGLADEPSVDTSALRERLIEEGGPATMLALQDPERALAYLNAQLHGDTLRLANLNLPFLPPQIGRFWNVPRLYLEGNRLTTLPDEVGDLFTLTWLNLARNRIQSLPRTLAYAPHLRSLLLTDNTLSAIPDTVFELAELTSLSIGDNPLTELPAAIGDLRALEDLSLYDAQLRELPASLANCPLTFLHLGNHAWAEPPAVIGELRALKTLWLSSPALERLTPEVCSLPALEELVVWHSKLREVPRELFAMTHLKTLRIGHNPLPDGTLAQLKQALPTTTIY